MPGSNEPTRLEPGAFDPAPQPAQSVGAQSAGPQPRTTLIVESIARGHRLYYVRLLAEAALSRGDTVYLLMQPDVASTPEYATHLAALVSDPALTGRLTLLDTTTFTVQALADLSHCINATLVVVPNGDSLALTLGRHPVWPGRGALSLLIMREHTDPQALPGLQAAKSQLRTALMRRASRAPAVQLSVLKAAIWSGTSAFPVATDPVTLTATADSVRALRANWALDDDAPNSANLPVRRPTYWFAVLGAITPRKNLHLVITALGLLPAEQQARLGLLIAGQIDDTVRTGTSAGPSTPTGAAAHAGQPAIASLGTLLAPLRAGGITVRLVDRVLTDIELDSAVVAADCLVLAHSNEGPSGLFGKAAAAGTRILAAGAASLKTDAAALPDTATWCPLTPATLAQALTTCAGQPRPAPRAGLDTLAFADALLGTLPTAVPVPGASARPGSEALL